MPSSPPALQTSGSSNGLLSKMHKKLPSFSFSSEPSDSSSGEPRRSRSIFAKLSGSSSRNSNRSPSPYAGRSSSKSKGHNSRSSSIERSESALSDADSDSDGGALSSSERLGPSSASRRYSGTAYESETSASELEYSEGDATDDDEDELSADEMDEIVHANTEANAGTKSAADILLAQPVPSEVLEDGPNLVKSPASPFAMSASSSSHRPGQPRRRKSTLKQEFVLSASRPVYERNRCSITLTHGDPEKYMEEINAEGKNRRKPKSYVVASDLSEESYYAIEWAIGE